MTSHSSTLRAFIDAAADAVARSLAHFQREAQREKEVRDAEFRARLAELDARIANVATLEQKVADRLASLKDGEPGRDGRDGVDGKDGVDGLPGQDGRDGVDGKDGIPGQDGKDGVDGKDADPEAMRSMIDEAVRALPPAKDGQDADMPTIEARIAEIAETALTAVSEAVAAIRVPDDGKSVTIEDVVPLLTELVDQRVADIPPPKDGMGVSSATVRSCEDGGHLILTMSDGSTIDAGRALGWDGADIDWDDVREHLTKMFDEWPKPKDGIDGRDGKDGKLPIVKAWEDSVHYENDVVTFEGRLYQAQRDTGKAPAHEDWLCITERGIDGADGRDGEDGRSFRVRGVWLEINEYLELDVVTLNGASFVAKRDDPGECPGDGWQLMASQGKRGNPGQRGAPGLLGRQGDAGLPVIAAHVSDEGLLTLTNGDGSTVTCDLYPLLAKLKQ